MRYHERHLVCNEVEIYFDLNYYTGGISESRLAVVCVIYIYFFHCVRVGTIGLSDMIKRNFTIGLYMKSYLKLQIKNTSASSQRIGSSLLSLVPEI